MKREKFLEPKESMRSNPNNTATIKMSVALNQVILMGGRSYYITDISESYSYDGVARLEIKATGATNPAMVINNGRFGWS